MLESVDINLIIIQSTSETQNDKLNGCIDQQGSWLPEFDSRYRLGQLGSVSYHNRRLSILRNISRVPFLGDDQNHLVNAKQDLLSHEGFVFILQLVLILGTPQCSILQML